MKKTFQLDNYTYTYDEITAIGRNLGIMWGGNFKEFSISYRTSSICFRYAEFYVHVAFKELYKYQGSNAKIINFTL